MKVIRNRRAWAAFAGLCIYIFTVYGLIVYSYGLLMPQISATETIPIGQMSFTYTVRLLCGSLATQLGSSLMKRVNSRVYFSVVSIALAGIMLCSSFASQFWQFLVLAACGGVFLGISTYIMIPLLCHEWFEEPAIALGIATAASGLGGVVFAPLLSSVIANWGWRRCFRVASAGIAAILIPVSILLQYTPKQSGQERVPAKRRAERSAEEHLDGPPLTGPARNTVFALCMGIFVMSAFSLVPALYPSMMLAKGVSEGGAGFLLSCMQLGNVAAPLLIGILIPRIGLRRAITVFLALAAVGCAGAASLPKEQFGALSAAGILLAFARIEGVAMPVMVRKFFGEKEYGRVYPKLYLGFYLTTAFVVSIYGILFDLTGGYGVGYAIMAGGLGLSIVLSHMAFTVTHRQAQRCGK